MTPDNLQEMILALAGVLGAVTLIWVRIKALKRRGKSFFSKINSAIDTLTGREAILHPDTGVVLVEATPSAGERLARVEEAMVALSQTNRSVLDLHVRVDTVATDVAAVAAALQDHLEDSTKAREEATQMWKTIEAVATSRPPIDPVNL